MDSEFVKTCHVQFIHSQISGVIGVDPCLNSQIGADPFNLLTIESKGKPSKEELNQNQQIQLKPKKKQGKPSDKEFRPELNQNIHIQVKPLNQNMHIQVKPKKKQENPSNGELLTELKLNYQKMVVVY